MPEYLLLAFDLPVNRLWTYSQAEGLSARPGCRVEASFNHRKAVGWVIDSGVDPDIDPALIKPYTRLLDPEPLFGAETLPLARWLAGMYFCSLGEALAAMMPAGRREVHHETGSFDDLRVGSDPLVLSAEQTSALDRILSGPKGRWYLYGPTGTGKTEVFIQAAEATLAEGRGVIYLVPEIALTHQVVEALRQRFGERCAIIHSGLTPSRKLAEWRRILRGEATVVIGARSAVFAPVRQLGLIVLDEEHENSYKAGNAPRYHARQVAMRRCGTEGARLVMGSATPSVEAWRLMNSGGIERLKLSRRLAGGDMPEVEIVDMRSESTALSSRLVNAVRKVKAEGGQSILFLNRRGFSYFWSCRSCGAELKCKHCSVGLTYHKGKNRLVCHYCSFSTTPPGACPVCGSLDTGWAGFGTERVEEEAARLFPDMSIARVDADSTAKKGVLKGILDNFRDRKIDILLGTQMVAKGLNFPGVRLVGVVLADTALNLPDFRAAERTYALITQVAGRAGRFTKGGKVIVQTFRPHSPVIRYAAAHDAEGFYTEELKLRRELDFPPWSRLLRIVIRSKDHRASTDTAHTFAGRLAQALEAGRSGATSDLFEGRSPTTGPTKAGHASAVEILGPAECPLSIVAGNARFQILLRSPDAALARGVLASALEGWTPPSQVYLEVDPDPVNLL